MTNDQVKSLKIRELNDRLRKTGSGGTTLFAGVLAQMDESVRFKVLEAVRVAEVNTGDGDDPYAEHDFGTAEVEGERYIWKIDYYDPSMEHGSETPEDPESTRRVLSIMRATDY